MWSVVSAIGGALSVTVIGIGIMLSNPFESQQQVGASDPFLQANFVCREDEVLTYDPMFGAEHVGCMHRDTFVIMELQRNWGCASGEVIVYSIYYMPDRFGCLHLNGQPLAPEVYEDTIPMYPTAWYN